MLNIHNITGVNIQFVPGEDLKEVFSGMEFSPIPTRATVRAVLKAQKTGQTQVDISTNANPDDNTDGGGGNSGEGGGDDSADIEDNALG